MSEEAEDRFERALGELKRLRAISHLPLDTELISPPVIASGKLLELEIQEKQLSELYSAVDQFIKSPTVACSLPPLVVSEEAAIAQSGFPEQSCILESSGAAPPEPRLAPLEIELFQALKETAVQYLVSTRPERLVQKHGAERAVSALLFCLEFQGTCPLEDGLRDIDELQCMLEDAMLVDPGLPSRLALHFMLV